MQFVRPSLGVVHLFDIERPEVYPRETDILETGFRPVPEIMNDLEGFETWSSICLKALFGSDTFRVEHESHETKSVSSVSPRGEKVADSR